MSPQPMPLGESRWNFANEQWPDSDAVAHGADLEPATIVNAYRSGVFPMPHRRRLLWWSPLHRGVLYPRELHISRSLRRSVRRYSTTVDQQFANVIEACADPRRDGAWINRDIRDAYVRLHQLGWAHSVEVLNADGALVGGLYGLAIGGLFAGESMFHHATDASKVALVELVRRWDGGLIDVQWRTDHLSSLGVTELPRDRYVAAISVLVDEPHRPVWALH